MRTCLLAILLTLTSLAAAQQPATTDSQPQLTVIRAGTLIDGKSERAVKDQLIFIRGSKIERVTAASGAQVPAGARVIDLSNTTVLPGLIDTHTHIFLQGYDPAEGDYDAQLMRHGMAFRAARATVAARRALEQGFTTIRDLETEGAGYGDVGIKRAIEQGYIPGPRMFVVTRAISTTGGYPLHGYDPEVEVPKGVQIIDGPIEALKAAREQMENGADWIKVYMTHRSWVDANGNLDSQPTLTLEELQAITDEVHGWKRKVACHAYNGEGLRRALAGGCDSIEHGLMLTDSDVQTMVQKGIWYVPTFSPYYPDAWEKGEPSALNKKRVAVHGPSFNRALKAGVKIAFGTDVGGFKWSEPIAREFGYMVEFGMTPMQAIQSATSRAAELLGMSGQIGVIAPGAYADIVAVQGDPLQHVKELMNVTFVMKDGQVFKDEKSGCER